MAIAEKDGLKDKYLVHVDDEDLGCVVMYQWSGKLAGEFVLLTVSALFGVRAEEYPGLIGRATKMRRREIVGDQWHLHRRKGVAEGHAEQLSQDLDLEPLLQRDREAADAAKARAQAQRELERQIGDGPAPFHLGEPATVFAPDN